MTTLCLDAIAFACPPPSDGASALNRFVNNLLLIEELSKENWVTVTLSEKTSEILFSAGIYPLFDTLQDAITKCDIRNIQAKRVNALVTSFLQKLPRIEPIFSLKDVLSENVVCNPPHCCPPTLSGMQSHLEHLLTLMILRDHIEDHPETYNIICTKWYGSLPQKIDVTAQVIEIESDFCPLLTEPPFMAVGQIGSCWCLNDLDKLLDPIDIWKNSGAPSSYVKSILLYASRKFPEIVVSQSYDSDTKFSFGSVFFSSVDDCGFITEVDKAERLLRSIVKTILKQDMNSTHWIRTSEGGSSSQKTRSKDGAKAWRRDIDHEFHLHYWETSIGPEFAKVVPHSDMNIPE